jgi:hypothetical protein
MGQKISIRMHSAAKSKSRDQQYEERKKAREISKARMESAWKAGHGGDSTAGADLSKGAAGQRAAQERAMVRNRARTDEGVDAAASDELNTSSSTTGSRLSRLFQKNPKSAKESAEAANAGTARQKHRASLRQLINEKSQV